MTSTRSPDSLTDRLARLRAALARHGLTACLIPSSDPHLSEYLPARWSGREWLSGFTGSAGTLIVTVDAAGLWVDSRYWVQAEAQLAGSGITLQRIQAASSAGHLDWLATHLNQGDVLAVDGMVLGLAAARALEAALKPAGIGLRSDLDLLEEIWPERADLPTETVTEHALEFACRTRADKLAGVRRAMLEQSAEWHLISSLDDIAWLFNLRGSDVPCNPVFLAHVLISADSAVLFTGADKIPAALAARLADDQVLLAPYPLIASRLAALPENARVLIDPRRVTRGLLATLPASARLIEAINPSTLAKSRKSAAEISHVRHAMEKDGAALCAFFAWFEEHVNQTRFSELDVERQLLLARGRQPGFVGPSFHTIAGFNANGALPHYRATPEAYSWIEGDGLLLIDSGGQYLDGTTDITRVIPVGKVSAEQKRDFTLVLKGMLALSSTRFPRGTRSPMLDAIARAPIWSASVDYGHGTGHGVGYFLNVHEGPQSISAHAAPEPQTAMEEGMITSIEPGIYRPGQWGVRIENLVHNRAAPSDEFGSFLEFEALTLCPIDTRCIDRSLLREDERDWLNAYHREVRARLMPYVDGAARAWLEERTTALP